MRMLNKDAKFRQKSRTRISRMIRLIIQSPKRKTSVLSKWNLILTEEQDLKAFKVIKKVLRKWRKLQVMHWSMIQNHRWKKRIQKFQRWSPEWRWSEGSKRKISKTFSTTSHIMRHCVSRFNWLTEEWQTWGNRTWRNFVPRCWWSTTKIRESRFDSN